MSVSPEEATQTSKRMRVRLSPNLTTKRTASGAMAVELASGECFSLNESGATFLEALRAAPPPSAPDLNALAQALNRPADEVTRDMEAFITRLCALGLAERVME